ncbi:hypothetical protein LRD18_06835 [Halorhodospira halochloris]|uniref:Yip1 domain-containing protein n=1 Tax=Halorhodospira halochloris TaxID=1052 RepID=A0A110B5S0_HALHR|nr:hypothetical protein [Halorhodospira halochloris]MBK1652159.1 hypothetical protein [Halorhodospira halochloris]MCG5530587.1 hypothetical protein [Halorhodospira halochloris]MCG5547831.1 hypothetical protein [Halorhodospira halochloris]BAU58423.1 hypothetical protein HH1059_17100 [Halorhodospira halochloris]
MGETIKNLIAICLLQKGPQDLPYSPAALVFFIAAGSAVSHIAAANIPGTENLTLKVLIAALFGLFFIYATLAVRNYTQRFMQTATAVFGADAVIAIPVAMVTLGLDGRSPEQAPTAALVVLLLWLWHISILGHILRHALDIRLPLGILIAIIYSFLSFQVVQLAT